MNPGKRIKEYRKMQGLTQRQFAKKLGVHVQTVFRWEKGTDIPSLLMLEKIAQTLNVSLVDLVSDSHKDEFQELDSDKSMSIGERIKRYRKFRNLTRSQLAEKVGVAGNTIYRYETGEINITVDIIKRIARALNVPITKLLEESPEELPSTSQSSRSKELDCKFGLRAVRKNLNALMGMVDELLNLMERRFEDD